MAVNGDGHLFGIETAQQRHRRLAGDQAAVIDDGDRVAKRLRLFEIVRRQQDRRPVLIQMADIRPKLLAQRDIDAGGRLIEHKDGRRMHKRLGDQKPAAHPPERLRA